MASAIYVVVSFGPPLSCAVAVCLAMLSAIHTSLMCAKAHEGAEAKLPTAQKLRKEPKRSTRNLCALVVVGPSRRSHNLLSCASALFSILRVLKFLSQLLAFFVPRNMRQRSRLLAVHIFAMKPKCSSAAAARQFLANAQHNRFRAVSCRVLLFCVVL